jgi:RNA polymerase sigma-70 factor, ECF subfamily
MGAPGPLAAIFLSARGEDTGDARASETDLESTLRRWIDQARATWPEIDFEEPAFVAYLAARSPAGVLPPLARAGDLLLAFACAGGAPAAIAVFHRTYGAVVGRVLARRRTQHADADDVAQLMFERLLVGNGPNPPKIADYHGTGTLRSWVSTTAATTLQMMRRGTARRREDADGVDLMGALEADDPEVLYIKRRYLPEIERAIVQALAGLSDRQRTLLRLHLGERTSIDHLGAMYGVNRATAARWLGAAREAFVSAAREAVRAQLRLTDSECDAVARLVRSQLDVSVVRHLSATG